MSDRAALLRSRDILLELYDHLIRALDDADAGKPGTTIATLDLHSNALASALTTGAIDIDAIRAEYRARLAPTDPRSWPRVPRYRDAVLPAVTSPAGA